MLSSSRKRFHWHNSSSHSATAARNAPKPKTKLLKNKSAGSFFLARNVFNSLFITSLVLCDNITKLDCDVDFSVYKILTEILEKMIELVKVSDNRINGTMRDVQIQPTQDSFVCRVQYLDDLDPFMEYNVREPPRPLYHTFNTTIPLSYQIAAVHRLLHAPHRVSVTL